MAEVMTVLLSETETYPLSACLSDTGGAAGLFLGLNVIGRPPVILNQIELTYVGILSLSKRLLEMLSDYRAKCTVYLRKQYHYVAEKSI